jgi:hypothetical protein
MATVPLEYFFNRYGLSEYRYKIRSRPKAPNYDRFYGWLEEHYKDFSFLRQRRKDLENRNKDVKKTDKNIASSLFLDFQAHYLWFVNTNLELFTLTDVFDSYIDLLHFFLREEIDKYANIDWVLNQQHLKNVINAADAIGNGAQLLPFDPVEEGEGPKVVPLFKNLQYGDNNKIGFENTFVEHVLQWDKPSLGTTANALEVLFILLTHAGREFSNSNGNQYCLDQEYADEHIKRFVHSQFIIDKNDNTIGYFQSENKRESKDVSNLYATRSALSILKSLHGLGCTDFAGETLAAQFLDNDELGGKEMVNKIRNWADMMFDHILHYENWIDTKNGYTIVDLHHANWIRGQLSDKKDGNDFLETLPKPEHDAMKKFVEATYFESHDIYPGIPTLAPGSKSLCMTACMYAVSMWDIPAKWENLDCTEKRIRQFVKDCERDDMGGFSSHPDNEDANIISTFLALRLNRRLKIYEGEESKRILRGVYRFLNRCRVDGGYALVPRMPGSGYGTRLAVQIYDEFLNIPIEGFTGVTAFIESLDWDNGSYSGTYVPKSSRDTFATAVLNPE